VSGYVEVRNVRASKKTPGGVWGQTHRDRHGTTVKPALEGTDWTDESYVLSIEKVNKIKGRKRKAPVCPQCHLMRSTRTGLCDCNSY
jgi:cytochrome c1